MMKKDIDMSNEQIERYSRQIILMDIGTKGMGKIRNSTVGVVGAGGLGCPAIQALVAAGIGRIKVIDGDLVEISNLPRQFLHHSSDIGKKKVDSIKEKAKNMNPDVKVEIFDKYLNKSNVEEFLKECDFVIEASDNFATKFLVNDACVHFDIPFSTAGVVKYYGQILSVIPGVTACYRCVFGNPSGEDPSNTCAGAGVMGTVPAFAGNLQANEAIKSIIGLNDKLMKGLFLFDLMYNTFEMIKVKKHQDCPACQKENPNYYKEQNYSEFDNRCNLE